MRLHDHNIILRAKKMTINSVKKAQIKAQNKAQGKTQIETLIFNKTPTKILAEYSNYNNVFLAKNIAEFSEHIEINNYTN